MIDSLFSFFSLFFVHGHCLRRNLGGGGVLVLTKYKAVLLGFSSFALSSLLSFALQPFPTRWPSTWSDVGGLVWLGSLCETRDQPIQVAQRRVNRTQ